MSSIVFVFPIVIVILKNSCNGVNHILATVGISPFTELIHRCMLCVDPPVAANNKIASVDDKPSGKSDRLHHVIGI